MANLFFDLDGTIWDSGERLYKLFIDLTGVNIEYDQYWKEKRNKVSNEDILLHRFNFRDDKIRQFTKSWMVKIEAPEYLALDKPFPFTEETLRYCISRGYHIYYVTLRQSKDKVIHELIDKKLYQYCLACLVSETKCSKQDLVLQSGIEVCSEDFMIGDTGRDIQAAKSLGIRSIGVLSGFRNEKILSTYCPDYILKDISFVHEII